MTNTCIIWKVQSAAVDSLLQERRKKTRGQDKSGEVTGEWVGNRRGTKIRGRCKSSKKCMRLVKPKSRNVKPLRRICRLQKKTLFPYTFKKGTQINLQKISSQSFNTYEIWKPHKIRARLTHKYRNEICSFIWKGNIISNRHTIIKQGVFPG